MDPEIIDMNRRAINAVGSWIDPFDYERSIAHYGCPPHLLPLLGLPINHELIYTDFILHAARRIGMPLSYLEIGVSVGKNFLAVANGLDGCRICGVDWERFNPSLARRFTLLAEEDKVSTYTDERNTIRYVQGNIFDEATWHKLEKRPFQIVFSDASHHPHALLHEFEMLRRFHLLDPGCLFMIWDDLDRDHGGLMTQAFFRIARELQIICGTGEEAWFLTQANGWLGEHEHQHAIGIFNSVGISEADLVSPG
jgi:hypothetical protein